VEFETGPSRQKKKGEILPFVIKSLTEMVAENRKKNKNEKVLRETVSIYVVSILECREMEDQDDDNDDRKVKDYETLVCALLSTWLTSGPVALTQTAPISLCFNSPGGGPFSHVTSSFWRLCVCVCVVWLAFFLPLLFCFLYF
jgi:hypothetical protein